MLNILWRTLKWRFQNPVSILITIVQPLIWLILYSSVAGQSMQAMSGGNYTAFILPGLMVLVTFSCCCSGGILNYIMKSSKSFYRILIAPVRRSSIVLGQMLEAVLLSFFEVFISIFRKFFPGCARGFRTNRRGSHTASGFFDRIFYVRAGLCY